ncbi:hypothetical protein BG015_001642 [Linnemannia schmuckeri]|uniref:Uncharacterized protein n=1 Tax=Linnemannia schmuckeri TaxID=64567 RepID=A0A9P5S710_9FUNG|nr:hypothetical protein BG015_001642 [Linnemannia schmuckeri]
MSLLASIPALRQEKALAKLTSKARFNYQPLPGREKGDVVTVDQPENHISTIDLVSTPFDATFQQQQKTSTLFVDSNGDFRARKGSGLHLRSLKLLKQTMVIWIKGSSSVPTAVNNGTTIKRRTQRHIQHRTSNVAVDENPPLAVHPVS